MKKINWETVIWGLIWVICVAIVIGLIAVEIYVYVKYGNKPADEIPGWVWSFWLNENR